ncbi:hypothetical protein H4R33_003073 [Dimargaris cristalligena]|uniref:NADH-ubiquinone oxidoreductase 9.5 kDa subunit n=1 Tax=Dimargaris cristalligena TaxID=215637 RepID=A0A4P9ZSQ9_9FUNG|nr:hypothetical protein H4R33_003073 [Dimargaris cristalligena]RKP36445.1 hypothetical protein BJ085DRAFT_17056 [Dimargaris cristalligena]|eukprot:RKP36445.1 hypothetical protein BJ085DRAFT_17056 [Dimargaris cristalligena]
MWAYIRQKTFEQPFIVWSIAIGFISPVAGLSIPFIRNRYFGWTPSVPLPKSYPVPDRPRRQLTGYDS